MSLLQQLICDSFSRTTPAGAVDLDGTNDYFSRASDLTGNADGKTFTFSAWVWLGPGAPPFDYISNGTGPSFRVSGNIGASFSIAALNASATQILGASFTATVGFATATFAHLLISIDLANAANRSVYVNDVLQTVTWSTYTNDLIDFTQSTWYIGDRSSGNKLKGRLAHVYLDYTYRDLSNVTNRRLFITADRKPAQGQASLNPILYMKMDDPSTAFVNAGTGGNFTLNGTIARSGRGPNQYNAVYSDLDGAADYLSASSITGIADGKQVTFSCWWNEDILSAVSAFQIGASGSSRFWVRPDEGGGNMAIYCYNASGTLIMQVYSSGWNIKPGRNYHLLVSFDLTSTSNRYVFLNGQNMSGSVTWSTYTNDAIDLTGTTYEVGRQIAGPAYYNGKLGDVWFNTSYIDLSQASNLAKFVTGTGIDAKPVDLGANGELPTGTSPLIYLPMYGNNAGLNRGTGGNFTVNSGPYTGARGPNEFWGNKATVAAATGNYLSRSSITGLSDSATWSFVGWFRKPDTSAAYPICFPAATAGYQFLTISDDSGTLKIRCCNSAENGWILGWTSTSTTLTTSNTDYCLQISRSGTTLNVYLNGVSVAGSFDTQTATATLLASKFCIIGKERTTAFASGNKDYAETYFTTSYIDFSQEANRLLFRDAFGNPTNLPAAIQSGTVPNPQIYMRFDPANQGLNSGTGGNFTKTGTITDGGQL